MVSFSSLKIAGKLYLMLLLGAVGIVAIAGIGHHLLGAAMDRGQYALVNTIPSFNALNQVRVALLKMRVLARDHVLEADEKKVGELDARIAEQRATIDSALRNYENTLISDEEDRRLLGELSATLADFHQGLEVALQLSRRHVESVSVEAREALVKLLPRIEKVNEALDRLIAYNEKLWKKSSDEAESGRSKALLVTILLTGVILSLLGILGWWIASRELARPIRAVVDNLGQLAAGSLQVTIAGDDRRDEVGDIARAARVFKEFVVKLDAQNWVRMHAGEVAAAVQQAEDLHTLAQAALSRIAPVIGAGHGAFYVADGEGRYNLLAGSPPGREQLDNGVALGEGLVGQCAMERAPIMLTVPSDYVRIGSGLGEGPAACILVQPIIHSGRVLGVLELASFQRFTDREKALLEALLPVLAASMEILDRNLKTRELLASTQDQADRLEKQAARLEEQTVEMQVQQAELRETEDWFRSIIDMSPDGMLVVDVAGRILLANPASEALFGYGPGELVGGQVEQLVPDRVRDRHPALRKSFMHEGRSRRMSESPTLSGRRKDGSEVRVTIVLSPLPARGSRGECVSVAVRPVAEA